MSTTTKCSLCGNSVYAQTIQTAVPDSKSVEFFVCLRCDMDEETRDKIQKEGWTPPDEDGGLAPA